MAGPLTDFAPVFLSGCTTGIRPSFQGAVKGRLGLQTHFKYRSPYPFTVAVCQENCHKCPVFQHVSHNILNVLPATMVTNPSSPFPEYS